MKIVVVGTGYVGLACVGFTEWGHSVIGVDIDAGKVERLNQGVLPIVEPGLPELVLRGKQSGLLSFTTNLAGALQGADICFICVGTPSLPDGNADLTYVETAVSSVRALMDASTVLVIKSTVPVGTCERFGAGSNPEFLREGRALADFLHPDRVVIGADEEVARDRLLELYATLDCPKLTMSTASAELTKYAANGFLATKISFVNEIANICDRVGANVLDVSKAIGLDPRIGSQFLQAGIGYGGSCFPKDTSALHQMAGAHKYDFKLLGAVIEANNHQRDQFVARVLHELGSVEGMEIGVWGLAFKAGTDDVRESAAIDVIERLLSKGAKITAFDPLATENARRVLGERIAYASDASSVSRAASVLIVLTEWPEFLEVAKEIPNTTKIFDGRNLLAHLHLPNYVGVGLGQKYS